jgi:FG-GAP-like repeat
MSFVSRLVFLLPLGLLVACPKDPNALLPINCISEGLCYQELTTITVGVDPLSIELGDVDGDSDLDAVSVNLNTIGVLKNVGGRLQPPQDFGVGVRLSSAALGDIDNDDDLDLVTAAINGNNNTQILSFGNDGSGNFSPVGGAATSQRAASFISLGDIDGDGDLDVVTPVFGRQLEAYLNNGDGKFGVPFLIGDDVGNASVLADFDQDGRLDIAVSDFGGGQLHILRNLGDSLFDVPVLISVGAGPRVVIAEDLDGDGFPELLTPNTLEQKIAILRNQGNGQFSAAEKISLPAPVFSLAVADIDSDGLPDLTTSNFASDSATIVRNLGQDQFGTPVVFSVPGNPFTLAVGDLNDDSLLELVFSCVLNDTLSILPASLEP